MSFLAELKRRNVIRMAGLYLVGAWLIVQVAGTVLPMFEVPAWVARALVIILALGFVPALVVAWVFELTPQGLRRDDDIDPQSAVRAQTWRRMDRLIVVALLIVIGSMAVERVWLADSVSQAVSRNTPEPADLAPPGSVAVLSFSNMSPDPENEYFADGIAEELLNVLAKVEGLKVASRTSAFSFKGKRIAVREIARQLNVAHVLEGSVRKQGTRVRITAQLIDASTDKHLWSETFDRELSDIFAVQQEIAQSISTALSGALGVAGELPKVEVPPTTQDLHAYELYLRGRQLFHQRGEALLTARKLLEEAVARDRKFAEAWAVLASVHYVSPDYIGESRAQANLAAREAAGRARGLDAKLALPYAVLAQIAQHDGELIKAERLLGEAIQRDPRDSTVLLWRGMHYQLVGNLSKSEQDLRRAFEIDPQIGTTQGWLAIVEGLRGNREAADNGLGRALELGWWAARWYQARFALADQDRKRAGNEMRAYFARIPQPAPSVRPALDAMYTAIADPAKNAAFYATVRADRIGLGFTGWGPTLALLGMHREAISTELDDDLPRANNALYQAMWFPTARGMLSEPAFLELAERDGLLAYWNAKGFPDGCRLVDTPVRHLDCTERWR